MSKSRVVVGGVSGVLDFPPNVEREPTIDELKIEVARLAQELQHTRSSLNQTSEQLQKAIKATEETQESWRRREVEFKEKLQEELLAVRERNVVLRDKLLAMQRAMIE
jgi:predicted  nucleic acid-binding Zn-ribbon protein